MPPKQSLEDRKAKLQAQLDAITSQEKEIEFQRLSALGAGLQSVFSADKDLMHTIMNAIDQHHKNNKHREILGLQKLASNRGRPKENN